MKAKARFINEGITADFTPSELYIVALSDLSDLDMVDTVYVDESDARVEANVRNSQERKRTGRYGDYKWFTLADIFSELA